ncbi:MAG: YwdI family protein [Bacillota bacterium]
MNISLQKLLLKMETELKGAREAGAESSLRERIHSLKTLCELVLDEPRNGGGVQLHLPQSQTMSTPPIHSSVVTPTHVPYQPQPQATTQSKKIEMDDGANGDSLLDF